MTDTARALALDDLVRDPGQAASLPAEHRAVLLAQACALIVTLASNGSPPPAPPSAAPERAVLIAEAATLLGMSKDFLYRDTGKSSGASRMRMAG